MWTKENQKYFLLVERGPPDKEVWGLIHLNYNHWSLILTPGDNLLVSLVKEMKPSSFQMFFEFLGGMDKQSGWSSSRLVGTAFRISRGFWSGLVKNVIFCLEGWSWSNKRNTSQRFLDLQIPDPDSVYSCFSGSGGLTCCIKGEYTQSTCTAARPH